LDVPKIDELAQLERSREELDTELFILTSQLAPVLDRMGRLMTDLSPHVAVTSQSIISRNLHNISNISTMTNDGSMISEPVFEEQLNPFLNPSVVNRARFNNAANQTLDSQIIPLHFPNGNLNFEVPVILTTGELLAVNPGPLRGVLEDTIQLTIQAHVTLPGNHLYQRQST
jgi:hypothetical protein